VASGGAALGAVCRRGALGVGVGWDRGGCEVWDSRRDGKGWGAGNMVWANWEGMGWDQRSWEHGRMGPEGYQ